MKYFNQRGTNNQWVNIIVRTTLQVGLFITAASIFSGCATFKTIKIVNGGVTENKANEENIIPFSLHGHSILVKVKLNNDERERTFVVDTGAITVINKKLADTMQFNDSIEVMLKDSTEAEKEMQLVEVESLKIGDKEIRKYGAGIIDLTLFERAMDIEIDGILGSNILRYFNTRIDYRNKEIILSQNTHQLKSGEYRIPFEQDMKNGFAPVVQIEIEDRYVMEGLIDTGYDGCVAAIPETLIDELHYPTKKINGISAGGLNGFDIGGDLLMLKSLKVGNMLMVSNIPVQSTKMNRVLLGKEFLEKFIVTINYLSDELILEPLQEKLKFKENIFETGLRVLQDEQKRKKVVGIVQDSPAERSGIQLDDEIVKVNGKKIGDYSKWELAEQIVLNDEVKNIELVIKRDDKEETYVLEKEFVFQY